MICLYNIVIHILFILFFLLDDISEYIVILVILLLFTQLQNVQIAKPAWSCGHNYRLSIDSRKYTDLTPAVGIPTKISHNYSTVNAVEPRLNCWPTYIQVLAIRAAGHPS